MILLVKNANILKIIQRHGSSFSYKNLPNESKQLIDKIIRVDHAGEFGANQIYKGQLAVLGKTNVGPVIQVNLYNIFNDTINDNLILRKCGIKRKHI
jgi:demethoxyubiquinone hydroxylase (CLK1/Coq7/Cat5 family)